jgi:5-(carboxyamino)imidazole ribonucleotide synthase
VALLGGGQLARMLSMAAHRLGIDPWVIDPKPDAPAAAVAHHVLGAIDDPESLRAIGACDALTAESDHVPVAVLERIARQVPVRPHPAAFAVAGDRLLEKRLFRGLGLATAPWARVDAARDLEGAMAAVGLPALLKTRHHGYDGKGQIRVASPHAARGALRALNGAPAILEGVVPFRREISILAVRGLDGEVRFWSPVENHHENGILRHSRPLDGDAARALERQGRPAVAAILDALDYVGVLAVEFFEVDGRLVANEIACRVHNSGHWTEEGASTSQFENHLRAVLGLPLGDTSTLGPTAMLNLIGDVPDPAKLLALPGARIHLYGKAPAPGRKLGHLTLRAGCDEALEAVSHRALAAARAADQTASSNS